MSHALSPEVPQILAGKSVLVTGAGTGIGRGVAIECARHGARVVLHYYNEKDGADSALGEIRAFGGICSAFAGDFRDLEQVRRVGDLAIAEAGAVDVLVNNAGITANIPFDRVTPEQFEILFAVNVRAPYFLTSPIFMNCGLTESPK